MLTYDINEFHRDLRPFIERAIEEINKTPPLEGNTVTIRVSDRDRDGELFESYGVTQSNIMTGEHIIHMNKSLFGTDGDLNRLRFLIDRDRSAYFHGAMTDPGYVLVHEYGHGLVRSTC